MRALATLAAALIAAGVLLLEQAGVTHEEVREAVRKDKEHAKCP